jgi:hypothetical protein
MVEDFITLYQEIERQTNCHEINRLVVRKPELLGIPVVQSVPQP